MPRAIQGICREPGCGRRAAAKGFCEAHAGSAGRLERERRGSASSRGYGRRHEKWRLMILGRDPVCTMPELLQRRKISTVAPCGGFSLSDTAHHVVPIRAGGAHFENGNGAGVCKLCHDWWTSTWELKLYPPRKP